MKTVKYGDLTAGSKFKIPGHTDVWLVIDRYQSFMKNFNDPSSRYTVQYSVEINSGATLRPYDYGFSYTTINDMLVNML